jgi:type VI secretion system protein ImpF
MSENAPLDRLEPCLLTRLTDDEPDVKVEGRDKRVVSMQRYRKSVLGDLARLLNSNTRPAGDEIYDFENVKNSVLNYGIRDFCGTTVTKITSSDMESLVKKAVVNFEPRLSPRSLNVRLVKPSKSESGRRVSFEIEGQLWAQPAPDHLFVKTELDLTTGHCKLPGGNNG